MARTRWPLDDDAHASAARPMGGRPTPIAADVDAPLCDAWSGVTMRAHVRFSVCAAALALAACATAPVAQPVRATQSDPPTVHVNVAGLFPVASSRTVGDARTLHPGLLARVSVEPAASIGTGDVEPWLSRRLLAWLVAHGSEVLVTPPGAATAQKPTATLVGVRFRHIKDSARVVVAPSEGGGQRVRYWAGKGDTSLCGAPITIQLSYVQLESCAHRRRGPLGRVHRRGGGRGPTRGRR